MLKGRERNRTAPARTDTLGRMFYYPSGLQTPYTSTFTEWSEKTKDEVHPDYPFSGGPFSSVKYQVSFSDGRAHAGTDLINSVTKVRSSGFYQGYRRAKVSSISTQIPDDPSDEAVGYGAEGWAKASPLKPRVDVGQFLYELRDLPSQVRDTIGLFKAAKRFLGDGWYASTATIRQKTLGNSFKVLKKVKALSSLRTARCFGKDYLLYQFGWRPFLSDLYDWFMGIKSVDERIRQIRNNNGKWQRRRATLFNTSETVNTSYPWGFLPAVPTGGYVTSVKSSQVTTTTEKCWFSGRMRYYVPGLDDPRWGTARAYMKLYGLEITPARMYALYPYTWLVGWFANIGHVVNNVNSVLADQLAAKYAYIMLHRRIETRAEVIWKDKLVTGMANWPYTQYTTYTPSYATGVVIKDAKCRVPASPFGFNTSLPFNSRQLAILTALGLSKIKY